MATGESFKSLAFAFRISASYIGRIQQSMLSALSKKLLPIFLPLLSPDKLTKSEEFRHKWNFPTCVRAIDGKHVIIFSPAFTGSLYFNYSFSLLSWLLSSMRTTSSHSLISGLTERKAIAEFSTKVILVNNMEVLICFPLLASCRDLTLFCPMFLWVMRYFGCM